MSAPRFGRVQKSVVLVPLALLSAAWTASLAGVPTGGTPAPRDPRLPDGTSIPAQAIEVPASVAAPAVVAAGVRGADSQQVVVTASPDGIPAAALAAYQRAETVINAADPACRLAWQLIAAIGRVESDHGRFGGNTLDANGVARPGVVGIALDGRNNTAVITDTDAGQYDGDPDYDRAVGPMQFIPATWSVVGVDADGDAKRNPQDIDDAALATAVYLCSGDDDLSTVPGQRAAVYRYNKSSSYVDLVLLVMQAYAEGDYTSVPNTVVAAPYITADVVAPAHGGGGGLGGHGGESASSQPTETEPGQPASSPSPLPGVPDDTTVPPTSEPSPEPNPVKDAANDPTGTVSGTASNPAGTVQDAQRYAEAQARCLAQGISLLDVAPLTRCISGLLD